MKGEDSHMSCSLTPAGLSDDCRADGGCAMFEVPRSRTGTAQRLLSIMLACAQVCRHKAAPVAEGSGCVDMFECMYHGWQYGAPV